MKSPSPFEDALVVMTLDSTSQTEFGVWVFSVRCLLANKVNQACEGPENMRVFSEEKCRPKRNTMAAL